MRDERSYTVILDPQPEGGFTVRVPALPEIVTEGAMSAATPPWPTARGPRASRSGPPRPTVHSPPTFTLATANGYM